MNTKHAVSESAQNLWGLTTIILAVVAIGFAACGTTKNLPSSSQMPGGATTAPPPGWVDYCARHPKDPSC